MIQRIKGWCQVCFIDISLLEGITKVLKFLKNPLAKNRKLSYIFIDQCSISEG